MPTLESLIDTYGVEVDAHLARGADVPVLSGLQIQGDVIVKPVRPGADKGSPVPAEGIPVVRGESGGNTHLLLASPGVSWRPMAGVSATQPILGTVTVADVAWIAHPEHGFLGLGAGTYQICRQVEKADELRLVAD